MLDLAVVQQLRGGLMRGVDVRADAAFRRIVDISALAQPATAAAPMAAKKRRFFRIMALL